MTLPAELTVRAPDVINLAIHTQHDIINFFYAYGDNYDIFLIKKVNKKRI